MELTARVAFEDGAYWAEVAELPGCFASGVTLDELREALEEAIALYLADDSAGGSVSTDERPRSVQVDELKLALA